MSTLPNEHQDFSGGGSQPVATHSEAGTTPTAGGPKAFAAAGNRADILDYLIDMIDEMKEMAAQVDCATLAGLLDLARHEATTRNGVTAERG